MLGWKRRPRSRLRTTAQLREITARSLPPRDCQLLLALESPASYICVLRDIDCDVYRIDSTDHPATYVDALLGEMTGSYGIELLSILETDDIAASEIRLNEHHHATLSDTWLDLDDHQLAELPVGLEDLRLPQLVSKAAKRIDASKRGERAIRLARQSLRALDFTPNGCTRKATHFALLALMLKLGVPISFRFGGL